MRGSSRTLRLRIAHDIAVDPDRHPAQPDDPQASLRAELLGKLVGAQFDLERAIAELIRSGAPTAAAQGQITALSQLTRQIGRADAGSLAALGGTVSAAIATAHELSRQATDLASANDPVSTAVLLAFASAQARAAVQEDVRDIYGRKIFDPYLHFASTEDEAAYRRREEENHRAIDKALAEHTPQGDLRATQIMRTQLLDAKAHGADASPEFASMWDRNARSSDDLKSAMSVRQSPVEAYPRQEGPARNDGAALIPSGDLAAALAGLRAAGIDGGVTTDHAAHGLSAGAPSVSAKRGIA